VSEISRESLQNHFLRQGQTLNWKSFRCGGQKILLTITQSPLLMVRTQYSISGFPRARRENSRVTDLCYQSWSYQLIQKKLPQISYHFELVSALPSPPSTTYSVYIQQPWQQQDPLIKVSNKHSRDLANRDYLSFLSPNPKLRKSKRVYKYTNSEPK